MGKRTFHVQYGYKEVTYRVSSAFELFDRVMRCRNRDKIRCISVRTDRGQSEYTLAHVSNPLDLDSLEQSCGRAWERYTLYRN